MKASTLVDAAAWRGAVRETALRNIAAATKKDLVLNVLRIISEIIAHEKNWHVPVFVHQSGLLLLPFCLLDERREAGLLSRSGALVDGVGLCSLVESLVCGWEKLLRLGDILCRDEVADLL